MKVHSSSRAKHKCEVEFLVADDGVVVVYFVVLANFKEEDFVVMVLL
jgi:ribosomal protein L36